MSRFAQSTSYDVECDVPQGFNFDKSNPGMLGFVPKLKIGDLTLPTDFELALPDGSTKKVSAVLRHIFWDGKKQSPIELTMQVSLASKQKLELLVHKEMKKEDVSVEFVTFDFDSGKPQAFYQKFHTLGSSITGVVKKEKIGDEVKRCLTVSGIASREVAEPKNFLFTIFIDPQGNQKLGAAASATDKWVEDWGMA